MKPIYHLIIVVTFLIPYLSIAQTKAEDTYRKESESLRKEIWGWDSKKFKAGEVSETFKNQSKVILAHHTELVAEIKSKTVFLGPFPTRDKDQLIIEIVREMIQLNDKSAVDEFSELSFTKFQKSSGFSGSDLSTTYLGVRILKPDGSIKEVNADEVVLTKDERNEKKARLAVPDLQQGDIIDYFYASSQKISNNLSEKKYQIILFDEAPILNYTFHASLEKKYAVEYRSYNGAPKLEVEKSDDNRIIINIEKKNIPPIESALWVAPAQQLPFIRLNISQGVSRYEGSRMGRGRPGEITENKDNEAVMKDKGKDLSSDYYYGYWMKDGKMQYDKIEILAKQKAKQQGLDFKQMNDEDKLALLFYTFRFNNLINFDINKLERTLNSGYYNFNGLGFPMYCLAKAAKLESAILVAPPRSGFRINEIMDEEDLSSYAYLPGSNKFFYFNSIFDSPFSVPDDFEGVKKSVSVTFRHPAMAAPIYNLTDQGDGISVPVSTADKNAHLETLTLSISPNLSNLNVKRKTVVKGFMKVDLQRRLILYEDFYEYERKALKDEKSLIETLGDDKKSKKYVDEVKNAFAEARKMQKDHFETEAKSWFNQEITEMKNFKVDNLGVRHTAPDFVYSSEFNVGGLVKKAGNNIILEIGKILGEQLIIKETQRKREIDVHMPFARSIENEIVLNIPDGFTVEGVNELNRDINNETGIFKVAASVSGKTVIIKVKKHYLHNYEPKENWEKMLAFLNASNDWLGTKLLLKKL